MLFTSFLLTIWRMSEERDASLADIATRLSLLADELRAVGRTQDATAVLAGYLSICLDMLRVAGETAGDDEPEMTIWL